MDSHWRIADLNSFGINCECGLGDKKKLSLRHSGEGRRLPTSQGQSIRLFNGFTASKQHKDVIQKTRHHDFIRGVAHHGTQGSNQCLASKRNNRAVYIPAHRFVCQNGLGKECASLMSEIINKHMAWDVEKKGDI
ncbi:hypothetical protein NPIL_92381 [Nephila pilipes]|uniref:Uncharacterized protein n=1 Tax=Nephila pilipes TaxID=299642 RepID=A0A8X6P8M2_NEPPI|nr:hypothetical protein NPIL_92381 [Nephila pilipes]